MINIVADSPTVSSLNNSGTCQDQPVIVPVSSKDVGNVEPHDTADLYTHNSASIDSAVTDLPAVGDGQSPVTCVSTASNTVPSTASTLGKDTTDDTAETIVGNESLHATTDTDLAASASCGAADSQNVYHVKWIKFRGSQMPIVMQNQNGPCPLLAIVNVLLLQGKIKLSSGADLVASDQLMAYIADWIFDNVPKVCN